MNRREVLAICACCAGATLFPRSAHADPLSDLDADFFYCGTEQVTDVFESLQLLSGGGNDETLLELGGGDDAETLDLYGTAQRALRWTIKTAGAKRDGKPLVRIGFVDRDARLQELVKTTSQEWLQHGIGVAFDFTDDLGDAQVRIAFSGASDSSSIGIEALSKGAGEPTMRLPTLAATSITKRVRRAVLHEFGHGIMAFGHEHRHPGAGFSFRPAVEIRDLINASRPPGSKPWTTGMVETNITNPPYPTSRVCSPYDIESIMHYPVQSSWLLAGSPVPSPATSLSARDRECATAVYAGK